MKLLIILTVLLLAVECHQYRRFFPRYQTRRWIKPKFPIKMYTSGFGSSLLCRVRHQKTVLYKGNKMISCQETCPTNYREMYSLHWGHHCKPIIIPKGCADEYCGRCAPGYKWIFSHSYHNRCVKECPFGYMATESLICIECLIDECEKCSDTWTCTKCSGDMALHKTFMLSTICVNRCPTRYQKVNQDGVNKCMKEEPPTTVQMTTTESTEVAFTTIEPATEEPTNEPITKPTAAATTATTTTATTTKVPTSKPTTVKVVALPEGCKDELCVNCKTGYFKYHRITKGSICLKDCPVGYSPLGSLCVACSDRRCASCKASLAECDKCYPGYSMLLDAFNITMECVLICPFGYKHAKINGVKLCIQIPEPACPISNCKRCVRSHLHPLHKGCQECLSGFVLFRGSFNDHCYASCPPGYFSAVKPGTNITACAKCKVPFCNNCTEENTCTECVEPLVLDDVTGRCTTCPAMHEYSFQDKRCIQADLNQPESNKPGPFIG